MLIKRSILLWRKPWLMDLSKRISSWQILQKLYLILRTLIFTQILKYVSRSDRALAFGIDFDHSCLYKSLKVTDASMLIQVFFFHHIFKPWETVNLYSQFPLLCPNHFTYFRPSININTLLSSLDTFSLISYGEFIFFPVRILEKRTETLSTRWRKRSWCFASIYNQNIIVGSQL